MIFLNLRNQSITLGELLENPQANALLQRKFGPLLAHPLVASAKKLTLKQLIAMAGTKIPPKVVAETLKELEQI